MKFISLFLKQSLNRKREYLLEKSNINNNLQNSSNENLDKSSIYLDEYCYLIYEAKIFNLLAAL